MPARRFLERRALRIFPGYWAAVVGVAVLFGTGVLDSAWAWVCNLFVLQQFGVREPLRITQAWSIGVELSFYLFLPVLAVAVARMLERRPRRAASTLALVCGLLIATGWAFRIVVVVASPGWETWSLNWLPMYLDFFAIGMLLSVLSTVPLGVDELARLRRLAEHAGAHPAICWLIAFGLFLLVAQMDPPPEPFGLNGLEYLPRQAAYCVGSAIWLAPAIFGDQDQGQLRRFLASRPMAWLGAISLSFYLWHLDVIHQAQEWTVEDWAARERAAANPTNELEGLATFAGDFWVVSAISIVVTIAIAAVIHHFVEVPFLRLKSRAPRLQPDRLPPGP
jgi:peptidoglycan/LPS O-acetylase OafA/YrhL